MLQDYLPRVFGTRRDRVFSTLGHAIATKYANGTRQRLLHELFQSLRLEDAILPCAVTAYDTQRRQPTILRSYGIAPIGRAPKEPVRPVPFLMADAAFATSAAPTYFPPALIHELPQEDDAGAGRDAETRSYSLVDGGLFANNPALVAYTEAKKIFPWAARFVIASVGTGISDTPYPHDDIRRWGFVDWVSPHHNVPLLAMMMDGQSDSAVEMLENLDRVKLFRFDVDVEHAHTRMDDASPANMKYLAALGDSLAGGEREKLLSLTDALVM